VIRTFSETRQKSTELAQIQKNLVEKVTGIQDALIEADDTVRQNACIQKQLNQARRQPKRRRKKQRKPEKAKWGDAGSLS
jgi:hypothetical protein